MTYFTLASFSQQGANYETRYLLVNGRIALFSTERLAETFHTGIMAVLKQQFHPLEIDVYASDLDNDYMVMDEADGRQFAVTEGEEAGINPMSTVREIKHLLQANVTAEYHVAAQNRALRLCQMFLEEMEGILPEE